MKTEKKKLTTGRKGSITSRIERKEAIYEQFTDLIIEKLEEGVIPWKQPWHELGMPSNYLSKKPYKGINLWLLLSFQNEYPYYLTFKQVRELGGKVKKGSKALPICYWNFVFHEKETGKPIPQSQIVNFRPDQVSKSGFLKEFKVFPIEQIEGIDWVIPEVGIPDNLPVIERCQKIYDEMPSAPNLIHNGNDAYYRSDIDQITLPNKGLFSSPEAYYGVLYHELIHSSGHSSRLNRSGITLSQEFGSEEYSKEELIAEMGAGFLNNLTGILNEDLLDNSAAYIQNWLSALRNNKQLLVEAAGKAQKAVDFITGTFPF